MRLLELAVLLLEFLDSADLAHLHVAVLALLSVLCLLGDAMVRANVSAAMPFSNSREAFTLSLSMCAFLLVNVD